LDLITLADYCALFPGVSLASQEDSEALCEFFESKAMKADALVLTYVRRPDFFALLRAHSPHFYVFVLKDPSGVILGAGSLVLREALHLGQVIQVGYLGDLRLIKPRVSGRIWRDFYKGLLDRRAEIAEMKACRYLYTCILEDNHLAQKALETKSPLGYHLFERYEMVNVFAQMPLRKMPTSLRLEELTEAQLLGFFSRQTKALGYNFQDSREWDYRQKNWPGFDHFPALGVRKGEQVVAATKLWSPESMKKMRLDALPKKIAFLLNLFSLFLPLPRVGESFRVLYMTELTFSMEISEQERQEAMSLLLAQGLKLARLQGFHALSFAHFSSIPLNECLRFYISHKTPLKLYLVDSNQNPRGDFQNLTPGFEMSLV
jgi:hypothetical protein